MFCHKKSEVGIFRMFILSLVAVSIYGDDSVCVLVYHNTVRIHTEGSYIIFKEFRSINDFTFIQFIGQVRENHGRQFHAHTEIHTIGLRRNPQLITDFLHPFTTGTSDGNNTSFCGKIFLLGMQQIAFTIHFCIAFFCGRLLFPSSRNFYFLNRCIKMKLHLIFQFGIKLFQNHVVDIRSQMTDGSIQKLQAILHTELLEFGPGRRKETGPFSSMFHIDFINIFHEGKGFFFSDIFIEGTAKIVCDIVFPVGKCPRSAKSAHNRTTLTGNTGLNLLPVNRTVPLFQAVPCF